MTLPVKQMKLNCLKSGPLKHERKTESQRDRKTERQKDRKTERQKDKTLDIIFQGFCGQKVKFLFFSQF
jgi:hypothetical protein